MRHYLAFDLGAESGRAMLGTLDGGRLTVEELHKLQRAVRPASREPRAREAV